MNSKLFNKTTILVFIIVVLVNSINSLSILNEDTENKADQEGKQKNFWI